MQEEIQSSIQQMRENLREVEQRLEQWQENYQKYLDQVERLGLKRKHLRHLMYQLEVKAWNRT